MSVEAKPKRKRKKIGVVKLVTATEKGVTWHESQQAISRNYPPPKSKS